MLLEINGLKTLRTGKLPAVGFGLVNAEIYRVSRGERGRGGVWQGAVRDVSFPP